MSVQTLSCPDSVSDHVSKVILHTESQSTAICYNIDIMQHMYDRMLYVTLPNLGKAVMHSGMHPVPSRALSSCLRRVFIFASTML